MNKMNKYLNIVESLANALNIYECKNKNEKMEKKTLFDK